jgi:hypothetical protein
VGSPFAWTLVRAVRTSGRYRLTAARLNPLTNFKDEEISSFDLTRDGKQFVAARGTTTSDMLLITDLK